MREALQRVEHIENQTEKARRLGVSEGTIRRWLAGEVAVPLRGSTRGPLERFLADDLRGVEGEETEEGLEEGALSRTAAEQLLHHLRQRAGLRRLARELTDKDLIAVAYTIARKDRWPAEELRKLDAWRDEILGSEGGGE